MHWDWAKQALGPYIRSPEYDPLGRPRLTPDEYINYLDPFNCECRAYGRLKQENREDLSVRVHGYILLTSDQERSITDDQEEDEDSLDALDGNGPWGRWEWHRGLPLRAIVKDLLSFDVKHNIYDVHKMYIDLKAFHELGILIRDLHPDNYLGGKLIDLSRAWTMYHPCLDRSASVVLKRLRAEECEQITETLGEFSSEIPEGSQDWFSGREEDLGFNPLEYDWRKWEGGVDEAGEEEGQEEGHEEGEV